MMRERGLTVDHVAVFRRVQKYAPEINKQMRARLKTSGTSYRLDGWLRKWSSGMRLFRRVISRILGRKHHAGEAGAPVGARSQKIIPDSPEARELYEKVAAVPSWFHSIDLGMGIVTPGVKSPEQHEHELAALRLPALQGKTVLDIGA